MANLYRLVLSLLSFLVSTLHSMFWFFISVCDFLAYLIFCLLDCLLADPKVLDVLFQSFQCCHIYFLYVTFSRSSILGAIDVSCCIALFIWHEYIRLCGHVNTNYRKLKNVRAIRAFNLSLHLQPNHFDTPTPLCIGRYLPASSQRFINRVCI